MLFSLRCVKLLETVKETLLSFPINDPTNEEMFAKLEKIRAKFRQVTYVHCTVKSCLSSNKCIHMHVHTGKNNTFPLLDILGYLKNSHKNPKFGKVRQVPTREFPTKFPSWTCFTLPNLGFLWVFFKYPKISKNVNLSFFAVVDRMVFQRNNSLW